MRNFIRIVEQADADDMYGDSSKLNTFGPKNGQEFTDRGRGNVRPRPGMDARYADNPMGDDQLDEFAGAMPDSGFTADPGQLDRLHTALTRVGMSDQEIMQGVNLTDEGKNKIAARFGISPEEVGVMVSTLIQKIEDDDAKSTDGLLSNYYSTMSEGANVPMVIHTISSISERRFVDAADLEDKKSAKDRDLKKKTARDFKGKQQEIEEKRFVDAADLDDKTKQKERDKNKKVARKEKSKKQEVEESAPPGKKAEDFIKKNKASFKERYGDRGEEVLYRTAWKQFGESIDEAIAIALAERKWIEPEDLDDKKTTKGRDLNKKKARNFKGKQKEVDESRRPFDFGVTEERFSFERDALNNVTVRDGLTGNEKYIQGTQATQLLSKLDGGANPDALLAPLMENENMNSEEDAPDYMAEIKASAGTYNFEWNIKGEHGTGTVMFRTDLDKPQLKLISVRDAESDEIHADTSMRRELLRQAMEFIGDA